MDKKKRSIPYPSDEEINNQVALIVKQGLPKKQSYFHSILEMIRVVGWRYLFLNRGEALFSGLMILSVLAYVFFASNESTIHTSDLYAMLFIISPLVFLSLMANGYYQKKWSNTFELEMTVKYTVFQLLAVRMLVYSSVAIFSNMTFVLLVSLRYDLDVLRGILLSMTGLFVFSACLLFVLRTGNFLKRSVYFIAAWVLGNIALFISIENQYGAVLTKLPSIAYGIILMISIWIYMISLKQVFHRKQEEAWAC
ncbi:hypothetical protein ACLM5H_20190 [Fredinandcohnia humi]